MDSDYSRSRPPHVVSAVPLDDLSTLGNDTYSNQFAEAEIVRITQEEPPELQGTPTRSNVQNLALFSPQNEYIPADSDDEIFKDEDDLSGGTGIQANNGARGLFFIAILCGPILLGLIAGLSVGLLRLRQDDNSVSLGIDNFFDSRRPTVAPTQTPSIFAPVDSERPTVNDGTDIPSSLMPSLFATNDGDDDDEPTSTSSPSTTMVSENPFNSSQEPTNAAPIDLTPTSGPGQVPTRQPAGSPTLRPDEPTLPPVPTVAQRPALEVPTRDPSDDTPTHKIPSAWDEDITSAPTIYVDNDETPYSTPRTTRSPSPRPSPRPTTKPPDPTRKPTRRPSLLPSRRPTPSPSPRPSLRPTTQEPTKRPSPAPTRRPTPSPSPRPSPRPSTEAPVATRQPTRAPISGASPRPSTEAPLATRQPTTAPTSGDPNSCPEFRYLTWLTLEATTRHLARQLDYDETKWNHPGTHELEELSYRIIPTRVSPEAQHLIDAIGFTPYAWDCCVNHFTGNSWGELEQRSVAQFYETLGWNEDAWSDDEYYPPTERLFWHELSQEERDAAGHLCFTQELWDEIPIQRWAEVEQARQHLFDFILSVSEESAATIVNDMSSPQYRAFLWLTTDYRYFSYSHSTVLQRWVLAVFALGLSDTADGREGGASVLRNWTGRRNECRWFSSSPDEVCNDEGHIERIDLQDTFLFGTIPTELSLLSNSLKWLYMPSNNLYGTLPTELGALTLLERLQFRGNLLDGPIPTELGRLSNLLVLGLGRNDFSGPIPTELANMNKLETLGIKFNDLTGSLPAEIGFMAELREIFVNGNRDLTGSLPSTFAHLSKLELLDIDETNLIGSIGQDLCHLPALERLTIDCGDMQCSCCSTCH